MELLGGAAVGAVFGEILSEVVVQTKQTLAFNEELTKIKTTLEKIEPVLTEITELSKKLNRPVKEFSTITRLLEDGKKLLVKCSSIGKYNPKKFSHAKKLRKLDNKLSWFFQREAQAILLSINYKILNVVSTPTSHAHAGGFSGSCSVPGIPEFIVGLDLHLAEVKCRLLKDETRVLVVSAPGGYGKTTLAKKLCHDNEIKGIFGDNILYVTVSKETSLQSIAQDLFKHFGTNGTFRSEEDAKNQIESLIKQKGSGKKLLLVLDDVWSESVIRHLHFQIPEAEYKILVTSRDSFPEFRSTYDLTKLNAEDAATLFCHYAFASDEIQVTDYPVNQMVKFCKGVPLALTVVGASLRGRPEVIWRTTLDKWSEGQSIFESHDKLLICLQTSIDELDELHKNCFLDLGLFPEDVRILGTILMDMWVELYKPDDHKGMGASTNLLNLSWRNLINLVPIRKVAGEMEGHCSQYVVMQHDVLRDLAIHMNSQEPEAKRKRLSVEIRNNNFPEWWTKQPVDARIMSISTDGELSSTWDDLNAPNVKVLILNIRSEKYSMPLFIEKMSQLKVLIVKGYKAYYTQLDNLQVLASLSKLSRIRFEGVSLSSSIQVIFTLKTLKKLTFFWCKIGDGVTGSPYNMLENLKELEISRCWGLKVLPAGLCSTSIHLQKLIIVGCIYLEALPIELGKLSNLEILGLRHCRRLKELPESIGNLRKLSVLDISGCRRLKKLPMSLTKLKQLKNVTLNEEKSYLLKDIESDLCNVKINFV